MRDLRGRPLWLPLVLPEDLSVLEIQFEARAFSDIRIVLGDKTCHRQRPGRLRGSHDSHDNTYTLLFGCAGSSSGREGTAIRRGGGHGWNAVVCVCVLMLAFRLRGGAYADHRAVRLSTRKQNQQLSAQFAEGSRDSYWVIFERKATANGFSARLHMGHTTEVGDAPVLSWEDPAPFVVQCLGISCGDDPVSVYQLRCRVTVARVAPLFDMTIATGEVRLPLTRSRQGPVVSTMHIPFSREGAPVVDQLVCSPLRCLVLSPRQ